MKAVLGGGPLKSVALSLAKMSGSSLVDYAADVAANYAQGVATSVAYDFAESRNLELDVSLGKLNYTIGAQQFGDAAGLFAGAVVGTLVGGGIEGIVKRGADVQNVKKGGTYVLRDDLGNVVRSGRSGDLARRRNDHFRDPALKDYTFEPVHRTNVYSEQRGLEKVLHDTYQPPLNKIRPISPNNPKLPAYEEAAERFLRGVKE